MSKRTAPIRILFLYPNEMNIYGDSGNVAVLERRLQWRGYETKLLLQHVGKPLPDHVDIVVGGGGQDSGQRKVYEDLLRLGDGIHELADQGVPMLMICGLYQLFGHGFYAHSGDIMRGIGIFNAETHATKQRLIGNIAIETEYGRLIGYENHSGQTTLLGDQKPFGNVIHGYGNDAKSRKEGAIYRNVYGTYLHGSLLPKNPLLADHLIATLLGNRGITDALKPLDDTFAMHARDALFSRLK